MAEDRPQSGLLDPLEAGNLIAQMAQTNAVVLVTVLKALHAEIPGLLPTVRRHLQATLDTSTPDGIDGALLRATLGKLIKLVDVQLMHPASSARSPEGIRETFRALPGGAAETLPGAPAGPRDPDP